MAHIYSARNDLADKLENTRQRDRSGLLVRYGPRLVLGAGIFLFMLFHFSLGERVRSFVFEFLYHFSSWVIDLQPPMDLFEGLWGRGVVSVILDMALFAFLSLLKIVAYVLLLPVVFVAPSVIRISLYALPLALGCHSLYVLLCGLSSGDSREAGVLRSGLEGEQQALDLLRSLNDRCHIFTNLRIPFRDGESETDLIVVTPGAVTIVEVKNSKGRISGDTSDEELRQEKTLSRGRQEVKTFRNPFRQVLTHVYRLKGYLKDRGVSIPHIQVCAFFVNPAAELQLTDRQDVLSGKCPVFTFADVPRLHAYLTGGAPLPRGDYSRTLALLEELTDKSFLEG